MRVRSGLDYDTALNEMAGKDDKTARALKAAIASTLLKPATAPQRPLAFRTAQSVPQNLADSLDLVLLGPRTLPSRARRT